MKKKMSQCYANVTILETNVTTDQGHNLYLEECCERDDIVHGRICHDVCKQDAKRKNILTRSDTFATLYCSTGAWVEGWSLGSGPAYTCEGEVLKVDCGSP